MTIPHNRVSKETDSIANSGTHGGGQQRVGGELLFSPPAQGYSTPRRRLQPPHLCRCSRSRSVGGQLFTQSHTHSPLSLFIILSSGSSCVYISITLFFSHYSHLVRYPFFFFCYWKKLFREKRKRCVCVCDSSAVYE